MTCTKPTRPTTTDPDDWAAYYEAYAEYIDCMNQKSGGGGYTGICDDTKELNFAATELKSLLTLVGTPPPPLPLTPASTIDGLIGQLVTVGNEMVAEDLSTQSGQEEAYKRCEWADDNTLPASTAGTLANLAGC